MKTYKSAFRNILIAGVTLAVFFTCGEIIFRAFFPEYGNHIITPDFILGKKLHHVSYRDLIRTRTRTENSEIILNPGEDIILVAGDSVTNGYGIAYEDIFWNYWQRMLELKGSKTKIISAVGLGDNFADITGNLKRIISFLKENRIKIDGVVYQFNFNDLLPYTRRDIKNLKQLEHKSRIISKIIAATNSIRLKYLYRSVMLRMLSYKLTALLYDNSKVPCERLGLDALGGGIPMPLVRRTQQNCLGKSGMNSKIV